MDFTVVLVKSTQPLNTGPVKRLNLMPHGPLSIVIVLNLLFDWSVIPNQTNRTDCTGPVFN